MPLGCFLVRFHFNTQKRNKKKWNLWLEQWHKKTLVHPARSIYLWDLKVGERFRRAWFTNKFNRGAKVAPHIQENRLKIVNRSKSGILSWNRHSRSSQQRCFINHRIIKSLRKVKTLALCCHLIFLMWDCQTCETRKILTVRCILTI